MKSYLEGSIAELSTAIQSKKVSPVEITEALLEKIEAEDEEINSFITVMTESALKEAREAEKEIMQGRYRGPLHGVPIGLKDLIYTKDAPTTMGSQIYKDYVAGYDGEVVVRLKEAGAIIVGKQNMHEFAYGTTGDRSYFGPVKNPRNLRKMAGGSSSGSAAAVAANFVFGSVGSDTGGSIRIPASCCGIVGLKPTFGLVSKYGSKALSWTLDTLGPMTRTVKDNAIMLNAMAGYDPKDPYSIRTESMDYTAKIGADIAGKVIAIPENHYLDILDPEVRRVFEETREDLRLAGAKFKPVKLEHMDELLMAQMTILAAESYAALEQEATNDLERIEEEVRARVLFGMTIPAYEYMRALKIKHEALKMYLDALEGAEVLMTPTLVTTAADIGEREIDINGNKEHPRIYNRLTGPTNTVGLPSISVPGRPAANGLPVGIQFIGRPFDEQTVYQFAAKVEETN